MIGPLLDAAITAAAGFFKSAEREREEWLSAPGVPTYAPKLTHHYQPWPGEAEPWPYRPWPGGERR
jgi:hypothetical protein